MKIAKFLLLFFVILSATTLVYFDVFNLSKNKNNSIINHVRINEEVIIRVETVATVEDRTIGLSGRDNLESNQGMLFVFDKPGQYFFWMKEMNFSIDIIWMNEKKEIIYIKKNAQPESYPDLFGPTQNSLYVLEVVSGFSDMYNLKEGDVLQFLP